MKFICVVPHYWGTGATPAEAKQNCKRAGGRLNGPRMVFAAEDDEAYVHEVDGSVIFRKGTECRLIEQFPKKKETKVNG